MKGLIAFIFPTIKAIVSVVAFMIGIGWAAYGAVKVIAHSEASAIEEKVIAVRSADMEHLNKRFDKLEELIKSIDD